MPAAAVVGTAAGLAAGRWNNARHPAAGHGRAGPAPSARADHPVWTSSIGVVAGFPPVAADGAVYVAGMDRLVAIHAATGVRLWDLPVYSGSAPVVAGGLIFIVVDDGKGSSDVQVLRAADGRLVRSFAGAWTVQPGPGGVVYVSGAGVFAVRPGGGAATDVWSRPGGTVLTTAPGIVLAGEDDRGFVLRAQDGSLLWGFSAGGAPPLVAEGRVFLSPNDTGSTRGGATALRLSDGAELWKFPASSTVQLATGGLVYLSNPYDGNGEFYTVRAADGAMLWRLPTNGASASLDNGFAVALAVDRGVVYLGGNQAGGAQRGLVYALRARDGKKLWVSPALGDGVHAIQVVSDVVYVSDGGETMGLGGGGRVSALSARDGAAIWSVTIGGASPAMTVTNDVVYVAHSLGSIVTTGSSSTVVALRSDNGARIWSAAALPEDFYGAAVTVVGHTAYVYGGDGKLYALRS